MCDMKKDLKRVHKIMVNMVAEKNEIRSILNKVHMKLQMHDECEEHLEVARKYYIKAMEGL